jgi:hypothetical protein
MKILKLNEQQIESMRIELYSQFASEKTFQTVGLRVKNMPIILWLKVIFVFWK